MLGRKKKLLEDLNFGLDILAAVALLGLVYLLLDQFGTQWEEFLSTVTGYPFHIQTVEHLRGQGWIFLGIVFCVLASYRLNRFYRLDLFADWFQVTLQSVKCLAIGLGMTAVFFYFFSVIYVNRSLLFGFAGIFLVYHVAKEVALRRFLLEKYYRRNPLEAVLVSGAKDVAARIAEFRDRRLTSVKIGAVALTDEDEAAMPEDLRKLVVGAAEDLPKLLSKGRYDFVFLNDLGRETEEAVIRMAEEQGVDVWYFAEFIAPEIARPQIDEYGGKPVIVFKTAAHYEGRFVVKRIFDIVLTVLFLAPLLPAMIVVAILIKATSRGPVFYVQKRTGWRGKPFAMFKFRTMVEGAEEKLENILEHNEMKGPVFKARVDPRVTPLGRFLRRHSIDELPQFFNVLRGEMSLVGPRPLPVYETEQLEAFKDHRRYSVLPGLTGLWQVSGRNRIENFSDWVRLDLEYIDSWSLWLDFKILLRTIPVVFSGEGAQ